MRVANVQASNFSPSMKRGLYFTKGSIVLYNQDRNINFVTKEAVKVSNDDCRYIEDTLIPQSIKDRFANIPFVKKLSKQFDTFIFFREVQIGDKNNASGEHLAFANIGWADFSKKMAEKREVIGHSPKSQEAALEQMFNNLKICNFGYINN